MSETLPFFVGCNYWASHAGIRMWRDWNENAILRDLDLLAEYDLTTLRVFPVWSDFQPLTRFYGWSGMPRDFGQSGGPLQNQAAMDDTMLQRFTFFCREAGKRNLQLVVSLLTGWMSGRLFVPPALEGKPLLTDAESIRWQVRFVRAFVRAMREEATIVAWDLGNECNCLTQLSESAAAWNWLNTISSAIRSEDTSRPVVSGMHGLSTSQFAVWNLRDQGELLDVLTTHPYPLFTPDCNLDSPDSLRNGVHASAESLLYQGLSGKPCFPEEAGSLGPRVADDEQAAIMLRNSLFTCWANRLPGYLWWCAFDQDQQSYPPYEWLAIERELGLFLSDRSPKPMARELRKFVDFLRAFPFELPPRRIDAVALISEREESWPEAFGAFLLSRQANFDLCFAGVESELPEAKRYLLPVSGNEPLTRCAWHQLLERVKSGAHLLLTLPGECILSSLEAVAGVRINTRCQRSGLWQAQLRNSPEYRISGAYRTRSQLTAIRAEILAEETDGNPLMTVCQYGRGNVYFINAGIERLAAETPGENDFWRLYQLFADHCGIRRRVTADTPGVGLTEHELTDHRVLVVVVNYTRETRHCSISPSMSFLQSWNGYVENSVLSIAAHETAVLLLAPTPPVTKTRRKTK